MQSAAIVSGLFRKLSEFVLANQEKAPGHRLIVLEERFEYSEPAQLEASATATLRAVFGAPRGARREALLESGAAG